MGRAPTRKFGEEDISKDEASSRLESIRGRNAAEASRKQAQFESSLNPLRMSELMDPSNQYEYDEGELERAKSVRGVEVSAAYEYVMVFKMTSDGTTLAKRNEDSVIPNYASSVIKALLEAQMEVLTYLSAQKDELICLITVSDPVLNEFADDKNYLVELDPSVLQYKMELGSRKNHWKGRVIEDKNNEFSKWPPYKHIWGKWESELPDVSIYKGLEYSVPGSKNVKDIVMFQKNSLHRLKLIAMMVSADAQLMKGAGVPVETLLHKKHVLAFYPMHQPAIVDLLLQKTLPWQVAPWQQPFRALREYFGEKVTLYFCFLGHYSSWLILPAIVGFVFQIVAWSTGPNLSHPVIPVFGAFICVWSICMLQFWKRSESKYAFVWGQSDFERQELQRPEYQGKLIRSYIDGRHLLYYPEREYRKKLAASTSIIISLICVVIGAVAGIYCMKFALSKKIGTYASTVTSIVNTVQITISNFLYTEVARKLVENENHKTQTLYQDSLIIKVFAFQFVNSYASFFFIAFVAATLVPDVGTDPNFLGQCGDINCMRPLAINLAIIFGTRLTITNAIEVAMMVYMNQTKVKEETEGLTDEQKANLSPPEREYMLQEYDATTDSITIFADIAIQFGFSTLFICALPIACACSLVSNHVKAKLQSWKLLTMYQRPVPQGAQDIGSWHKILSIISVLSVLTNAGLICFTMDVLYKNSEVSSAAASSSDGTHRASFSPIGRLWIFVCFIVSLLVLQFVIADYVPDETDEVQVQKKRQDLFRSTVE